MISVKLVLFANAYSPIVSTHAGIVIVLKLSRESNICGPIFLFWIVISLIKSLSPNTYIPTSSTDAGIVIFSIASVL